MQDKKWSELWKGEYNASTQYEVSDTVSYNGSTYTCILYPPVGTAPTNTTYWRLVAQKGNTGDQGPQGPQGLKGDKGDKGDKGLNWRGTWSNSTAYSVDDAVYYNGSSYVCIQANTGQTPTNTSYWELIAQKGDTGSQGPQGPQGVQGPQGPQGDAGVSAGLLYAFNTDTTDSDPGNGQLKFNNATISSVTQIFIDNLENGGGNVSSFIDTWDDSTDPNVKGIIKITKRGAENNFAVFNITGLVVNGTGYRKVTVSHVSSSGSFSASDILSVLFSRTGNKGTDGSGAGDVVGPSSATNNNFAAFDGTTGKLIKDSGFSASSFESAGAVSTHASSTSTHGVSGNLVGTTDTQTLTNKKLTSPKIETAILDTNGNEIIETPATTSAVNQIKITNAATGVNPTIEASGDDTNINLYLKGKGTGRVKLYDGSSYIDPINTNGWVSSGDTWTYASATSFTISGVDRTAIFTKGTRIKLTQTTDKYFVVTSSSFSTNTTVNITGGSDYTLANATITNPYYSYQANPQGYPTFFNWTPTWSKSGTPPSIGNGTIVGKMMVVGNAVYYYIKVTAGSTTTFGDAGYAYYFAGHPISSTDAVFTGMVNQAASPYGRSVIGSQGTGGWLYYSASPYAFNASSPFTLVNGDYFYIAGWGSF
jgi:hypothetical protein